MEACLRADTCQVVSAAWEGQQPLAESKSALQGLLADADTIVNNGEWEQLSILLDRVQNQPNFMKTNLKSAIGGKLAFCRSLDCNLVTMNACFDMQAIQMAVKLLVEGLDGLVMLRWE